MTTTESVPESSGHERENRVSQYLRENLPIVPVECVLDQGEPFGDAIEKSEIANRPVTVSKHLSQKQRNLVRDLILDTKPERKLCFTNSLQAWHDYPEFEYVEGYAMVDDWNISYEHSWLALDGHLVDITIDAFDDYYGVRFSDPELLSHYYELGMETNFWGIIGNHTNRFEYLHSQGYY